MNESMKMYHPQPTYDIHAITMIFLCILPWTTTPFPITTMTKSRCFFVQYKKNPLLTKIQLFDSRTGENDNDGTNISSLEAYQAMSRAERRKLRDLSKDGIPTPLLPIAEAVDEFTGGWALNYADLRPETETTPAGVAFLATNVVYALAGIALSTKGELLLGVLTEVAGTTNEEIFDVLCKIQNSLFPFNLLNTQQQA